MSELSYEEAALDNVTINAILAVVLIALFFAVSRWQSDRKLSKTEVDHYIEILEKQLPKDVEDRAEYI